MTPDQIRRRNDAIRRAFDDPLIRALMSAQKGGLTGRRKSRAATNEYFREYRKRKRGNKMYKGWGFNISGMKFGKLIAIEPSGRSAGRGILWKCKCDCGTETNVQTYNLRSGKTISCGCLRRENPNWGRLKHGDAKHRNGQKRAPEYNAWLNMKRRCYRKNDERYMDWGGRGITVCERWLNNYEDFLADMGRKPAKNYSIERVNNDGNYELDNCVWATRSQQQYNQRRKT
jgi:hypothetical protein